MTGVSGFFDRHRAGVVLAVLLLASSIMMLFSGRNVVLKPQAAGQSLFSLLQTTVHGITTWFSNTWNSIGELRELRAELDAAREQLAEYERASRSLTALRRENEALRDQLSFSRSLLFRHLPAEVVARDPGNDFSTLVVNKGRHAGVKVGMPVVAFQNGLQGLVGKVVEVGLATSIVKPITDPTSYVAARLQDSRYDGLVSGRQLHADRLLMSFVSKLAVNDVQYGELAITSGMGRLFPKGIAIGRVRQMEARSYEASLELEIQPIIDFSRLEYVFLLASE